MPADKIEGFELHRFSFPKNRVTGDSQVKSVLHRLGAITLHTTSGQTGLGFFSGGPSTWPDKHELERVFRQSYLPSIRGQSPQALLNRVTRKRGGNYVPTPHLFDQAIDQALWDLTAKAAELPLYRLLGGTSPEVESYASDLGTHCTEDELNILYTKAKDLGFKRVKVKVGDPDIKWDLERLAFARKVCGPDMVLMVDANEAWSPQEAIIRLATFRDNGFDIFWVEDPCERNDFEGLREIRAACPFTLVNSGEYLDLRGKTRLITARATDVINVHGHISDGLRAAWLANEHSLRVSVGNTPLEIGVHLAAALPGWSWLEYSFHNTAHLLAEPLAIRDGKVIAPDRPGHGFSLSQTAIERWSVDHVDADPMPYDDAPEGPLDMSGVAARSTSQSNLERLGCL